MSVRGNENQRKSSKLSSSTKSQILSRAWQQAACALFNSIDLIYYNLINLTNFLQLLLLKDPGETTDLALTSALFFDICSSRYTSNHCRSLYFRQGTWQRILRRNKRWRIRIRQIVKHQAFYWAVIVCVFLNTIIVACQHYRQPEWLTIFQGMFFKGFFHGFAHDAQRFLFPAKTSIIPWQKLPIKDVSNRLRHLKKLFG